MNKTSTIKETYKDRINFNMEKELAKERLKMINKISFSQFFKSAFFYNSLMIIAFISLAFHTGLIAFHAMASVFFMILPACSTKN